MKMVDLGNKCYRLAQTCACTCKTIRCTREGPEREDGGHGEGKEPLHSNQHILSSCYMPVGAGSIYGKWVSPSGREVAKRGPPLDGLTRETHLFG